MSGGGTEVEISTGVHGVIKIIKNGVRMVKLTRLVFLFQFFPFSRYNDYKHDPLARCNCTPPYSGENAISARSDLNPADGKYPIAALGHRQHGGIDAKVSSLWPWRFQKSKRKKNRVKATSDCTGVTTFGNILWINLKTLLKTKICGRERKYYCTVTELRKRGNVTTWR